MVVSTKDQRNRPRSLSAVSNENHRPSEPVRRSESAGGGRPRRLPSRCPALPGTNRADEQRAHPGWPRHRWRSPAHRCPAGPRVAPPPDRRPRPNHSSVINPWCRQIGPTMRSLQRTGHRGFAPRGVGTGNEGVLAPPDEQRLTRRTPREEQPNDGDQQVGQTGRNEVAEKRTGNETALHGRVRAARPHPGATLRSHRRLGPGTGPRPRIS